MTALELARIVKEKELEKLRIRKEYEAEQARLRVARQAALKVQKTKEVVEEALKDAVEAQRATSKKKSTLKGGNQTAEAREKADVEFFRANPGKGKARLAEMLAEYEEASQLHQVKALLRGIDTAEARTALKQAEAEDWAALEKKIQRITYLVRILNQAGIPTARPELASKPVEVSTSSLAAILAAKR